MMTRDNFLWIATAAICLLSLQNLSQALEATSTKQASESVATISKPTGSEKQINSTINEPQAKLLELIPQRPKGTASKSGRLKNQLDCDYEKEPWEECKGNVQQRTLRLRNPSAGSKCESIKLVRRECKLVPGCKYMRGRWSPTCSDGLRLRIDTLVASNPAGAPQQCQPIRRVVKDCRRSCHYIKNQSNKPETAWSDCVNGFKTRNLTLQEPPPPAPVSLAAQSQIKSPLTNDVNNTNSGLPVASENQMLGLGCVKQKMIRKECKARDLTRQLANSNGTSLLTATAYNKNNNSFINNNNNKTQPTKLTAAQRRRLKQLQKQQQQQLQQQRR